MLRKSGKPGCGFWVRLSALPLALFLLISLGVHAVWAEPHPVTKAAIAQAQGQAQALQERIQQLNDQAEQLVENYDAANTKLGQTKAQVAATQANLSLTESDLKSARNTLSAHLVEIYEQGDTGMLQVLLEATSFSDLINRVYLLEDLSKQDHLIVQQVSDYQSQVKLHEATLAGEETQEQANAAQVLADKQAVEAKLAANQQALKGDQQQIAQMEKAWQAQQAKLAAEARAAAAQAALKAQQARAAAQQAALKAQQARAAAKAAQQDSSSGSKGSQTVVNVPASGSGAKAVQIALKYMGVPYVWGGANPSGFDCSGLVMYVYGQLGVSLPHSAAMQYQCGTHVSRDQLEPGDLVFFGSPIHHVGIYVGNGDMIDAPYTGVSVRIDPLQSDYAGATRIF